MRTNMKTYPLLQSQLGVLLQSMQHPESTQYNLPLHIFMPLSMPRAYVVKATHALLASVPALHTRFVTDEQGEIRQWCDQSMDIPVVSRKCTEEELQAYLSEGFVRPFDLFGSEPLFRAEVIETEKCLCLVADGHHAIVDGMSFAPILTKAFARVMAGGTIEMPSYGMYQAAEDEAASFGTPLYQRAKDYYAQKFAGLEMATLSHSPYRTMGSMGRHTTIVSRHVCDDWCEKQGVKPYQLFQAAFCHVIAVLTRQQQVAYVTIHHGRMDKRLLNSVGMFVKSLPMQVDANPSQRVVDFVKRQRAELINTMRNSIYPFTHFCSDLGMKPGIIFDFLGMADMEEHVMLGGSEIRVVQPVRKEIDSDLSVDIYLNGDSYEIRVQSSLAMNDAQTIQMVAEAVRVAVCNMIAHPEATLGELDIVSDEERDALIQLGTGEHLDIDPTMTFVKAFEQQARKTPDSLAVADGTDSLTYSELSRRSDILAQRLIASGVKPGDFVAVMLDRTIDYPLAVIAIHKAGAAYVPIDLEYPKERQKYMLEDCEAKVIIDSRFMADIDFAVSGETADHIDLSSPDGPAYMIYTSGSTGKPKGAVLHQAGLWNFIQAVIGFGDLTASDRIACHRSFSFDAHIGDLFPILTLGGSLHIMPSAIRLDLKAIRSFLTQHQITGGGYATAMGKLLLNTYDDLPVRFVALGGERLTAVYSDHITIINVYGPTECTDDTSFYKIAPGTRLDDVPIGRPVANCYYFLIDQAGRLVPRGAVGELCFAGIQVGRGYWHQPELTAEKFTDCPFIHHTSSISPLRMYRTGDLCRWNDDGQMEYIGRIDSQVKLRGYRVELGEVETCAVSFEGINQAVAVIKPLAGSDTLCLYYTTVSGVTAIDTDKLSRFMAQALADYMVPAAYMQLDALPLTPNGKVDRRKLPEPQITATAEYVAPQTKAEKTLVRLTGDVLSWREPISMLDSFFALGGDSIKLISLVSLLRNEGFTAQVSELMQCSTLRDMASILVSCNEGPSISQEPVVGAITPGAIQHRFLSWHLPHPGRFTQSMVLRAQRPVDATLLQQALQALAVHHDMLRAIVSQDTIVIRPATDERLFAFEEMKLRDGDDVSETIAGTMLREGELVDLEHGPILRAVLLHAVDGDRLLMVCHHIACDGVSWRIMTDDLHTAMTQLEHGEAVVLPRKTHSFGYWTESVSRYRDSYLLSQEKPYWQSVQQQMETMELTPSGSKQTQQLTVSMEGEQLNQLLTTSSKAYNTEINDLLVTVLCQSYHRLTGSTELTLQMEGHGREPLHEAVVTDRTVGWFTSVYPIVIQAISGDIRSDVRHVKEQLRTVPNKGIGYGILQYIASQKGDAALRTDLTPLMGFNYLGEADSGKGSALLTADGALFLSDSPRSGQLEVPIPSVDINCGVVDGCFVARFEYDAGRWTDEEAQRLADGFVDCLAQVAGHTAQVTVTEPTASDYGATGWTEKQFQDIVSHFAARGETLQRVYPLSPMQEGILITYLSDRDTTAYRLLFRLSMAKLPTETELRNTLDYIAEKHEVLRTAILYDGVPQPCQAIVSRQLELEMLDLTSESDIDAAAARIHQEQLQRPLSLTDDSLFRIVCMKTGDDSCQLLVFMHHIITDGWSTQVIFHDFLIKMEAEADGRQLKVIDHHQGGYEKFIRQLLRRDRKAGLDYWKNLLAGYDSRAAIPSYGKPVEAKVKPLVRHTFDKALTASLRQLAAKTGVTLNTVLELGWGLMLQSFCRTDDAVFLRVVSGRNSGENDNSQLLGLFINSVPVRVRTASTDTVRQSLKILQEQAAQSASNDFCPLSDIQQQSGLGSSLYQSILAFENYPLSDTLSTAGRQWAIKPVQIEEEAFGELSLTINPEVDGTLQFTFIYDTSLYGEQQMRQIAETYETIVSNMAAMPDGQLRELPLVTDKQRDALIQLGTGKHIDIAPQMTFVKAFERQSNLTPDNLAVADATDSLTYVELSRRSNILAHRLIESGVKPGDLVAVMLDRTIDYPLAVLAIHKAGAAYVPIDLEYPEERQKYMLDDCQAKVIIDERFMADIDFAVSGETADHIDFSSPDGLAYMIYTSGSTGKPKGVMIRQGGLSSYIASMVDVLELTSADRISLHRPFSFDAHIHDLYPVLTVGGSLHIMPSEIRRDIQGMCDFIASHGITGGSYTTSLGKLLIGSGHLPLRYMSLTGERMADLVSDDVQLFNGYGPTECTDLISIYRLEHGRSYSNIPIGRPLANGHCFIVDPYGRLVPRGAEGELCFASVQVSAGYWNQPELTAEKFVDCPFLHHTSSILPLKMYRTGDLCRWNDEGLLEFLDRVDSQVKLRGYRIELGEIESCAVHFDGIRQAVAVVKTLSGSDAICLYYTVDEPMAGIDTDTLRRFMAQTLADYMVPAAYMQLDILPLTPSGKVDRRQLPEPSLQQEEVVAPASELEQQLFDIVAQQLGTDAFGVTTNLVTIGMSSLDAMRLSMAVGQQTGLRITVSELLETPTVRQIAEKETRHSSLITHQLQDYYPLTENQRGIYIDWEMNRNTTQYNVPVAICLGQQDATKLVEALHEVVDAHSYIKTRLAKQEEDVVQLRRDDAPVQVTVTNLDSEPGCDFFQQRVRPFNLFTEDLYRLEVYTYGGSAWLFKDFHHIVSDGLSDAIFFRDLLAALQGQHPQKETVTAFDYALYEQQLAMTDRYAEARDYFDALLSGVETASYPRSANGTVHQSKQVKAIVADSDAIREACHRMGITPNSYFQTVVTQVLHRLTRQERLMLATVSNGRSLTQTENMMGMFVKTLPLVSVGGDIAGTTFATAVKAIHRQSIESMSRDFYPLTEMVKRHGLHPEIIYAFEGGIYDNIAAALSSDTGVIVPTLDTPKMPIGVTVYPDRQGVYTILLSYDSSLYSQTSMEALADALTTYAAHAVRDEILLSDIEMITDEQRAALVELGTGEHLDIDPTMTFVKAFEQQARKTPDSLAVADGTDSLTYSELSRRSDILAQRLIASGVKPGDFVAVMLDRTIDYPLAVIAIHKAGAAYVPIDLEYPKERQKYMLEDCEAKVIIDSRFMADIDFAVSGETADHIDLSSPDGPAYMIYTSGSTGKPKGAVLHQAGLWNFIQAVIGFGDLTASDRIACHRSFSFDAHIGDLFPILTLGGSLHIMPSAIRLDLKAIRSFLTQHQITGGGYATAMGKLLLNTYDDLPVRFVALGGERLTAVYSDHITIINVYGPTECTDDTSFYKIAPGTRLDDVPIGRPVANCYYFLIDQAGRLVPRGAVGELCFAGIQVGRGYWHQPELTAEKFTDCPFIHHTSSISPLRMYRTGDLCRWNDDGQMEFIGRKDAQVKLRGYRIELGEIEGCASQFAGVGQVAAQIINGQYVCLYYTVTADVDVSVLKQYLTNHLAAYMVPTTYMQLDAMPLNANGKVDRRRLPAVDDSPLHTDYVAPESEMEKLIVSGFEKVLNQEKISVNDDFVRLGGDSLDALKLVFSLGERGITVADVLSLRTPAAIAGHAKGVSVNLDKYSIESGCPLNNSQMFIYNDIVKFNKYDSYLIPFVIPIDKSYTDDQIRNALDVMFTAHPVLTMHVALRDGVPYMEKGDKPAVMKGSLNPLKILSMLTSGFDLYSSLSRHVIVRALGRCYLVSVIHHLIFDAVSTNVFCRHFLRALEGEKLDFVDDHFLKVSAFHQEVKSTEQYAETDKYIRSMLSNLSEANFYRNPGKHGKPGYHKLELGVDREQVNRFTERFGITKNVLFTAAMSMTLSKLAGSDDVAFGFLDNGRDRFNNFEDLGLYINGMPIVTHVDHHDMRSFLERLSDVYYKLSQNSYFPFASLVQEFNISPIILFQFFPDWITEDGKYDHLPHNETLINAVVSTQKDFMVEALVNVDEKKDNYTFIVIYSGYYSRKMMKKLAKTYKETVMQMLTIDN